MRYRNLPLCLAAAVAACNVAAASPIPYEDLQALLRSDFPEAVILAIVEEEGAPRMTAEQWLGLRDEGASDELLLALLEAAPPVEESERSRPVPVPEPAENLDTEQLPREPEYRAFYDEDEDGTTVFVLTNLDADGRRLGGSAPRSVPSNRVTGPGYRPAPREVPEAPEAASFSIEPASAAAEPHAPVEPMYVESPSAFVPVSPYYGFFYRYPLSHFYPPGSHTHLKLFHQSGSRGFGHYQLPAGQIFYQPPFPVAGSHRPRRR